uniref:Calcium-transporting ATPase, endoplasmic reticulum-type-like n=1 Tax=Tanacetum cinerariifolium TaxID=118510 RepID=A0A699TNU5_TANCI|nr:calcium-transporting ATPase, endoplasmic reticulum-type-like [Tanacetum cinerariifolium]
MIVAVVALNAAIGFFTEWKAQQSVISLQSQEPAFCDVIRDGIQHGISAQLLVPGDLLVLSAGNKIAADGRIAQSHDLQWAWPVARHIDGQAKPDGRHRNDGRAGPQTAQPDDEKARTAGKRAHGARRRLMRDHGHRRVSQRPAAD